MNQVSTIKELNVYAMISKIVQNTVRLTSALFLAVVMWSACGQAPSKDGLITSFGDYPSPDGHYTLKVQRRSVSLVFGSLVKSDGAIVFSEEIGSDAMRWCFHWSSNGTLWAYSSDTGYLKQITPRLDGSLEVREVPNGGRVPEALYNFLPSSLRSSFTK